MKSIDIETRKRFARLNGLCASTAVTVAAQGHLLRVRMGLSSATSNKGGGYRGNILAFSRQSRKRMLETLACIDLGNAGFICFVTLTYPDEVLPVGAADSERDRQTILKRFARQYPEASAIWRREWEARKSGEFQGEVFPHFHLLFFNLPFVHYENLNGMWGEVIGHDGYLRTEIKAIASWKQALYYVAKYMAKPAETSVGNQAGETGQRCGDSRGADRPPVSPSRSLVYSTYLTGQEEGKEEEKGSERRSLGRSWGIFNRKHLPLAKLSMARLQPGEWIGDAKEAARRCWAGVDCYGAGGFTLFVEEPEQWLEWFRFLAEDRPEDFTEDGEYAPLPS